MDIQQYPDEINQGTAAGFQAPVRKDMTMNRREELQVQYEDALFALMMDELAKAEDEAAQEENERLKNDPSAAVPEEVDKRCLQTIHRCAAQQKAHAAKRRMMKAVKYALLAAGLAVMMFTVAFAASETVRISTMNLMIEIFEENTVFEFMLGNTRNPAPQFGAGWLPDGYVLEEQSSNPLSVWFQYRKSDVESICIKYALSDGARISVDTEDAETEYVEINGIKAMLISKDEIEYLIWATQDNVAFIQIIGEGASQEDILHVARELNY